MTMTQKFDEPFVYSLVGVDPTIETGEGESNLNLGVYSDQIKAMVKARKYIKNVYDDVEDEDIITEEKFDEDGKKYMTVDCFDITFEIWKVEVK